MPRKKKTSSSSSTKSEKQQDPKASRSPRSSTSDPFAGLPKSMADRQRKRMSIYKRGTVISIDGDDDGDEDLEILPSQTVKPEFVDDEHDEEVYGADEDTAARRKASRASEDMARQAAALRRRAAVTPLPAAGLLSNASVLPTGGRKTRANAFRSTVASADAPEETPERRSIVMPLVMGPIKGTAALLAATRFLKRRQESKMSIGSTVFGSPGPAARGHNFFKKPSQMSIASSSGGQRPGLPGGLASLFTARQPLLQLAKNSEWAQIEIALKNIAKNDERLNIADSNTGETVLMLACRDNKLVIIERLLELGATVNARASDGRTALHYAAQHCHDDVVKVLLAKKADPNIFGGLLRQLPLHIVLSRPHGVHVTGLTLLRATARDARLQRDGFGYLPISYAVQSGYFQIFRECLVFYQPEQIKWRHEHSGDYLVHIAARKRNLEIMTHLAQECNANMNVQNADGQTPLHIVTTLGDEMMVRMMQSFKANANIVDSNEQTPIHIAAELGHTVIVEVLVERFRAKVHLRTKDGSTLMHRAAEKGYIDTVEAFIRRGVALHMPNKQAFLALHIAAVKGHVEVVKLLVQRGSPVDARTKDQYTALHLAVINCHPEIIQTLLGFGAKVDLAGGVAMEAPLHIAARLPNGYACAEMLLKSGANCNKTDGENGETPLHITARHGYLSVLEMLLGEDGDPTRKSKFGENVLHVAVRSCHFDVIVCLLDFMKTKFSQQAATDLINNPNNEGETSCHLAAVLEPYQAHYPGEEVQIVKLLLENGADPLLTTRQTLENSLHYNATSGNPAIFDEFVDHLKGEFPMVCNRQNKIGRSPLMVACERGHASITEILLKKNARADVFDEQGKAALHLAAENGHVGCCEMLLKYKAFVNAKTRLGLTPLHLASANGYIQLVKTLVEKYHAAVNALSLDKKTPLHLAGENGKHEVCQLLMQLRANADDADELGQRPLHLAAANDHQQVMRLFIRATPDLLTTVSKNGMSAAHIAANKGSISVIKELMKYNKSLVISARVPSVASAMTNAFVDSLPIHLAVSGGYSEVVRILIDAGTSATAENAEGMNAIHLAAKEGNIEVLQGIPSKNSLKIHSHKNGLSPVHIAAFYGHAEFVREILQYVDANIRTQAPIAAGSVSDATLKGLITSDYGFTCLHLAAFNGHANVVRQLFNVAGVESDVPTTILGRLPMHMACINGHLPVVSILMSRTQGLLSVVDNRGRMPLHLAAENGHIEMVSNLLGQGADINAADNDLWTALHFATRGGYIRLVKLLVEGGATPTLKTSDGRTALMIAAAGGHIDSLSYLMTKDHDSYELLEENSFLLDLMLCGKTNNNKSIDEFVDNSKAPLYMAARLARLYRDLAFKEKERAKDLNDAGRYMEHTATELLGIAATAAPPSTILRAVDYKAVQLLDMFLEDNLKEVIEHAVVQRYLSEIWAGSLSNWPAKWLVMLFLGFFFFPPMWAYYCLPLKSYHRYYHIPIIKFLALLVSHTYLIIFMTMMAAMPLHPIVYRENFWPQWYEYITLAWVSGMLVSELTNQGSRSGLAMLRTLIVIFSVVASVFQVAAIAIDETDHETAMLLMYLRNFMLSLSLFSAILLYLDFLLIHHLFGEFGIIIAAVFKDLVTFLVIVVIFVFAFTFQMCCIYSPVQNSRFIQIKRAEQNYSLYRTAPPTTTPNLSTKLPDYWYGSGDYYYQDYDNQNPVIVVGPEEAEIVEDLVAAVNFTEGIVEANLTLNLTSTVNRTASIIKPPILRFNLTNVNITGYNATQRNITAGVRTTTRRLNLPTRFTFRTPTRTTRPTPPPPRTPPVVLTTLNLKTTTSVGNNKSTRAMTPTTDRKAGLMSTTVSILKTTTAPLPTTLSSLKNATVKTTSLTSTARGSTVVRPNSTSAPMTSRSSAGSTARLSTSLPKSNVTARPSTPLSRSNATSARLTTSRPLLTTMRALNGTLNGSNATNSSRRRRDFDNKVQLVNISPLAKGSAQTCRPRINKTKANGPNLTTLLQWIEEEQAAVDDPMPELDNKDPLALIHIFVMLYFALFGMTQLDNLPNVRQGPWWSRLLLEAIFGVYMLVTSIILIPLLIAMLTETYKRIHQRSEAEWKFGRAKLIRSMVKISSTPPPLNLFVRPYIYINAVKKRGWEMFTIYANYYIAEDEHEGADEMFEHGSTAAESRAGTKSTPRRTGATKSALQGLGRRLLVTKLARCLPCLDKSREAMGITATPLAGGGRHPARAALAQESEGPQRIEDVLDWAMVVRRYRSDTSDAMFEALLQQGDDGGEGAGNQASGPAENNE